MADKTRIKIYPLKCGSIFVSKDCLGGGNGFYLPQARAMTPDSRRIKLPVYAFLIEHPKARILIDTGLCRDISPNGVYSAEAAAEVMTASVASFYKPCVGKGEAIHERLASLKLRPDDIDYVLLTHLDADHVCGLRELDGARHIMCAQENYWWSCRTVYKLRQPKSLWYSERLETFWYKGMDFGPHFWSRDFFDDGSMMLVNLPGHTDGQFGVVLQNKSRFALMTGDAAFDRHCWEKLDIPGFGFNRKSQMKSLKWIKEQSEKPACLKILASHDRELSDEVVII